MFGLLIVTLYDIHKNKNKMLQFMSTKQSKYATQTNKRELILFLIYIQLIKKEIILYILVILCFILEIILFIIEINNRFMVRI